MVEQPVLLTQAGLKRLEEELHELRTTKRAEVALALRDAQELGMAQVDGQYEEAKNQQAFLEGRILEIEKMLERAQIIDDEAAHSSSEVRIVSSVTVRAPDQHGHQYQVPRPPDAA